MCFISIASLLFGVSTKLLLNILASLRRCGERILSSVWSSGGSVTECFIKSLMLQINCYGNLWQALGVPNSVTMNVSKSFVFRAKPHGIWKFLCVTSKLELNSTRPGRSEENVVKETLLCLDQM
jgi:hypothetical protein